MVQRKVVKPGDFADLDALAARLIAFQGRYNTTATPFDLHFTRADLTKLLARLDAHRPTDPDQQGAPKAVPDGAVLTVASF